MADGNQLKIGDQIDLAEDDPFAELTRIMGFDPRQSVKQQAAEETPTQTGAEPDSRDAGESAHDDSHAAGQDDSDDFSIDLEKELMGEFSFEEDAFGAAAEASAESEASATQADAPAEDDALDIDFDFDSAIAASVDAGFGPSGDAAVDAPQGQADGAPVIDLAEDDHGRFDDNIAAELHAAMDDVDFDLDANAGVLGAPDDSEAGPAVERTAEVESTHSESHDHLDLGLRADDLHLDGFEVESEAASLQPATSGESGDSEDAEFHLDPADLDFAPELSSGEADAPAHAEPFLQDGDDHAADMDFSLDTADLAEDEHFRAEAAGSHEDAPGLTHHDGDPAADFEPDQESPTDADFGFGDIDFAAEDIEAAASPEPEVEIDPDGYDEPKAYAQPDDFEREAAERAAARVEPEQPTEPRAPSPMDIAAAEYRGRDSAPADLASAFNLEDELKALLGDYTGANAPAEQPAAAGQSAAAVSGDDDLAWELDDLVEAATAAEAAAAEEAAPDDFPHSDYAQASDERNDVEDRDDPYLPAPSDNRYAPAAAGAAAAGIAAAGSGMFSRAPAFAMRHQQRADDTGADYRGGGSDWAPSRTDAPRDDAMREDPLDVIAELTAKYSQPLPTQPVHPAAAEEGYDDAPEVETIEVADRAVALADDLEIPEVDYQDELPPVSAYDDLDSDFASLLHDLNDSEAAPAEPAGSYQAGAANGYQAQEPAYRSGVAAASVAGLSASTIPGAYHQQDDYSVDADDLPGSRAASPLGDDEFDYDPDLDDALAVPGMAQARGDEQPQRRGLLIAAIVGGVALVGALGAFALSSGDDGSDTVAIVKADDGPIKVKPENPGGTTVPNQDSKVYETVAGEGSTTDPQQQTLVTTAEEPIDVAPPAAEIEDDPVVAAKSEDRIEQILQETENQSDAELAAVAPRKVRTMVVRPDGTLVPREESDAGSTGSETVESAGAAVTEPAPESTGALTQGEDEAMATFDDQPSAVDGSAVEEPASQTQETVAAATRTTPATAPIAPQRPAEQPVDVVGEVKPDQVASAASSAAGGGWSMQIASQPNEAAAQSSYQNLARRYSSVLEGRPVNIVKADIAGKGTFWRVRVPAASRNDAIALCETYKAAGGNCFVSR